MTWDKLDKICIATAKLMAAADLPMITVYLRDDQWKTLRSTISPTNPFITRADFLEFRMASGSFTFHGIDVRLR